MRPQPEATGPPPYRRLYRHRDDRFIAGVAAGLAEHLRVPPLAVRIAFVALLAANGVGALLYGVYWAVLPVAPAGTSPTGTSPTGPTGGSPTGLGPTDRAGRARRGLQAFGLVALAAGVVLLQQRVNTFGVDPALMALAALVALGAGIIWHRADLQRSAEPGQARRGRAEAATGDRRWFLAGIIGGGLLVIVGIIGILGLLTPLAAPDLSATLTGLLFALLALAGLVVALAPALWRMFGQLRQEREGRIREQERAEVAAVVHDQVLHTLALIQRNAADARSVAQLARGQERTLRQWLYAPAASPANRFAAALEQAAAEVEDTYAIGVETVIVGDADTDEHVRALIAAAREAVVNAARHAQVQAVSLYAEAEPEQISVYVRDRGVGFDPDSVVDDRHGLRGSIIARMLRHGGQAQVRSHPGAGTEVVLTLPRTPIRVVTS